MGIIDESEANRIRLSDRILSALDLAIEQEDLQISETLMSALDQSMTRKAGGGEFVERRTYPPEAETLMRALNALRERAKSVAQG